MHYLMFFTVGFSYLEYTVCITHACEVLGYVHLCGCPRAVDCGWVLPSRNGMSWLTSVYTSTLALQPVAFDAEGAEYIR